MYGTNPRYDIVKNMKVTIIPINNQSEVDSSYSAISDSLVGESLLFACCTHMPEKPAVIYSYNIRDNSVARFSDTNLILPDGSLHGKIHTPIVTDKYGDRFCATHFAYPYGLPQPINYPGSRLIKVSKYGDAVDLGLIKPGNGVIYTAIDNKRSVIYLLTIPDASLFRYNISDNELIRVGDIPSTTCVSRNFAIDHDGRVFGCYEGGGLFVYDPEKEKLSLHDNFLPTSSTKQWNSSSRGGVNRLDRSLWRGIYFCQYRKKFFGILSSESRIFTLDPLSLSITLGEDLSSNNTSPDRKSNIFPTLSLAQSKDYMFYASSIGLFDYNRTEMASGFSQFIMINKDTLKAESMGEIRGGARRVYGIMTATTINDSEYVAIGAVERLTNEPYNPFNVIDGQPFILGVIRISI
jgi:hypothetical protein